MAMKPPQFWTRWCERFAARSRRERAMIGAAIVLGAAFVGSTLFVEPQLAKVKLLSSNVAQQKAEQARLSGQWSALQTRLKEDPDAAAKAEKEMLKAKLRAAAEELAKANGAMVPPAGMNALLERILSRQPGLRLVSLRTLPLSSFMESKPADAKTPAESANKDFDIYRHGVEIKLAGSYSDLYGYLAQLEADKQKLLWGEVQFKVLEHPKAEMTLVVYTLSVDKEWLSL